MYTWIGIFSSCSKALCRVGVTSCKTILKLKRIFLSVRRAFGGFGWSFAKLDVWGVWQNEIVCLETHMQWFHYC